MRKETAKILVVDDDPDILLTGEIVLKQRFTKVTTAEHPGQIADLFEKDSYDVVLLDMNYSHGDNSGKEGLKWIEIISKKYPNTKVVVITAYGDVGIAVEAMKKGAVDFVTKPWEYEKIQTTVLNAVKLGKNEREIQYLKSREKSLSDNLKGRTGGFVGKSERMKEVFQTIEKVAKTDANVLILGENGTGKTLVAQAIHRQSNRSDQVFMPVDLGSLSDSLFESELFGHKKGAFTDAREDRIGRFEAADGGTIFLDEIGNLSAAMQSKLLTSLQQKEITRIGENKSRKFNSRIIAATNREIFKMIEAEEFREDLYYRINTIEIELPPLRDRLDDLPLLLDHFIAVLCNKYQRENLKYDTSVIKKLSSYSWPGNIRELEHATERAIILTEGNTLKADDFLLKKSAARDIQQLTTNLEELEELTIRKVIDKHAGNMSKVAKELGIGRTTLYRKLEKYGL